MSARINQVPAYVVYDRSFQGVATLYGTSQAVTGNIGLTRDGDLTTLYSLNAISTSTSGFGVAIEIDYGKIFTNCQISYKADFTKNNGSGSASWAVSYSIDGTNYTDLDTGSVATGNTDTITNSKTTIQARYVKFNIQFTGLDLTTRVYECRLMGSG